MGLHLDRIRPLRGHTPVYVPNGSQCYRCYLADSTDLWSIRQWRKWYLDRLYTDAAKASNTVPAGFLELVLPYGFEELLLCAGVFAGSIGPFDIGRKQFAAR